MRNLRKKNNDSHELHVVGILVWGILFEYHVYFYQFTSLAHTNNNNKHTYAYILGI